MLQGESFSQTSELRYYAIAGMTVAMRDGDGLKYLLTDHLGSVVAVTEDSGTLISQQRYLPFGGLRENVGNSPRITQTDLSYTGQRAVDGLGLLDYKARMYDPTIARFVQPDTIIPSYADPQALNWYSYVNNEPTNLNDPTGHQYQLVFYAVPVVLVTVIYLVSPQFRDAAKTTAEYMWNVAEQGVDAIKNDWRRGLDAQQQFWKNVNGGAQTSLDPNNPNNSQVPKCFASVQAALVCAGLGIISVTTAYAAIKCGQLSTEDNPCTSTESVLSEPEPASATNTPSCPPYIQCPSPQPVVPPTSPSSSPQGPSSPTPVVPSPLNHGNGTNDLRIPM